MISIKRLTTSEDLANFVDGFNRGTSKRGVSDLDGVDVKGVFWRGKMVGGYAINTEVPYEYINDIPEDHRSALFVLEGDPSIAEISSLWVNNSSSNFVRAFTYNSSVISAAIKGPDMILGASYVEAYRAVQMRALPNLLWSGKARIQGSYRSVHYFYGSPLQCICRLPYATISGWLYRVARRKGKTIVENR